MGTNRLKVSPNERVDIEDFRFVAGEGIHANLRQLGHKFLLEDTVVTPQDRTGYILSGFEISNPAAKQLQVDKGKAILSQRINGVVVQGVVTTEGDATKIIDLNTYSPGVYGIFIRFEENEGAVQGRIFWNPTGLGSEYTNSVPTRYLAGWSLRVEVASPGNEWLKIGEVNQADMDIVDQRPFYFEGAVDEDYLSGWSTDGDGGANDRNAVRSTYGVKDLHTFIRATKQCLEDIKGRGLRRWWDRDIGGMNIGFDDDPIEGRLAIGSVDFYFALTGSYIKSNLLPTTDNTYYLGNDVNSWKRLYVRTIYPSASPGEGFMGPLIPALLSSYSLGNLTYRWLNLYLGGLIRAYDLQLEDVPHHGVIGTFKPAETKLYGLGDNTHLWKYLFLSDDAGDGVETNLVPYLGSLLNLGNATYQWHNIYVNHAYITDLLATASDGIGEKLQLISESVETIYEKWKLGLVTGVTFDNYMQLNPRYAGTATPNVEILKTLYLNANNQDTAKKALVIKAPSSYGSEDVAPINIEATSNDPDEVALSNGDIWRTTSGGVDKLRARLDGYSVTITTHRDSRVAKAWGVIKITNGVLSLVGVDHNIDSVEAADWNGVYSQSIQVNFSSALEQNQIVGIACSKQFTPRMISVHPEDDNPCHYVKIRLYTDEGGIVPIDNPGTNEEINLIVFGNLT